MQIRSVELKNFKRFQHERFVFADDVTDKVKDIIMIVGPNGSGKSSILQAIAMVLGKMTGRLNSATSLKWSGLDLELAGRHWRAQPEIEVEVDFAPDELAKTLELRALATQDVEDEDPIDIQPRVRLKLTGSHVACEPATAAWQFRGRRYAAKLVNQLGHEPFRHVGAVFWYRDDRSVNSYTSTLTARRHHTREEYLRQLLAGWQIMHDRIQGGQYTLHPSERDLFAEFERAYKRIFPNRKVTGIVPRSGVGEIFSDMGFFFEDGKRQYELRELSAGERAVFPVLFDFINYNVHHSVILIDEFELHLHPPMQQQLLRSVQQLGIKNQVIFTTHSDAVAELVPDESIVRLKVT